jgi:pimeloyl-ACP methyl ester carboxylesterase
LTRAALQTAFVVSEDLGTSLAERLFTTPRRHPRPARERAILASAREIPIDVALRAPRWQDQHCTIRAWRWGHGPTVLLVHGWEGRGSQLGSFVEPLVAAGMSVVAFDAPGHGDSPGHRLYLSDLADCIAAIASVVGPLHAIIAHSFGCAGALLAYARHGIDAARNIMIAPNVLIDDAFRRFARLVALDEADRGRLEAAITEHGGVPLDDLRVERLVRDRESALLVLHDRADREVPFAHATALAAAWPAAHLVATDGLGHRRILRDRDVIARIVDDVRLGTAMPASDLVREVDRYLDEVDARAT